ncbi:orotidine-5'-phosphate decarboxylase [Candidatus Chlorohelix allophototropha]|uniref:Orotidine 5'-phosphate decarboxylase n=1 Tax=Candidatus Chlorohelix allophototropha TaxID=3003348 RepID=A0ABY9B518_9CHLR|nr:orotidine-5'-phosphate decarboxylase [Chloroflexota bacterium L227-S17]
MIQPRELSSDTSPSARHFGRLLERRWRDGFFLCVGLDPEYSQIPAFLKQGTEEEAVEESYYAFCRAIVEATAESVCAFKPNLAFFEQAGPPGLKALKRLGDYLRSRFPEIPLILDAKRGDIASTNKGYVASLFDYFGGDAVTVQPYLGGEALEPYLERAEKGVFVLCRTSNPGSAELQMLSAGAEGTPLYLKVAQLAANDWNSNRNVGLVAGATYPAELAQIRAVAPDVPLLVPGVGAQGGDLEAVLKYGRDSQGYGLVINSSRGIIYAGKDENFAEAAGVAARKLAEEIKTRID